MKNKEFLPLVAILIIVIGFSASFDHYAYALSYSKLYDYWDFNQTVNPYYNRATAIGSTDSQGSATDLSESGTFLVGATGKINHAINLTGSDGRFLISGSGGGGGTNKLMEFLSNETALFTYNDWIKQSSAGQGVTGWFGNSRGTNANSMGWGCEFETGTTVGKRNLECWGEDQNNLSNPNPSPFFFIQLFQDIVNDDTNWHFYAIEYNGTSGATNNIKLSIDGGSFTTFTVGTPRQSVSPFGDFQIGNIRGSNFADLGLHDEAYLWGKMVSLTDLQTLYGNGNGFDPNTPANPSIIFTGADLTGSGAVASIYQGYMQTRPQITITNNPVSPNNACITEIKLYNYTNLLQTIPTSVCPASPTDFVQANVITQGLNNYMTSNLFVNATWNRSVFDLNFSPTIPVTVTSYHFMISHLNSTSSASGGYSSGGSTPMQPACTGTDCPPTTTQEQPIIPIPELPASPFSFLFGGGNAGQPSTTNPVNAINFVTKSEVLNLGEHKTVTIDAYWQTTDSVNIQQIVFGTSPYTLTPSTLPPIVLQGTGIGSNGKISIDLTVPDNYCEGDIKTNCLDPNTILYTIPVTIDSKLGDKSYTVQTVYLTFTVLRPQTVATYTIIALIAFVGIGLGIQRYLNGRDSYRKSYSARSFR